jgi:hypothetical protein
MQMLAPLSFDWSRITWRGPGLLTTLACFSYGINFLATIYLQWVPAWENSMLLVILHALFAVNIVINALLCVPILGWDRDLLLSRVNILFFDGVVLYALIKGPLSRWAFVLPYHGKEDIIPTSRKAFLIGQEAM